MAIPSRTATGRARGPKRARPRARSGRARRGHTYDVRALDPWQVFAHGWQAYWCAVGQSNASLKSGHVYSEPCPRGQPRRLRDSRARDLTSNDRWDRDRATGLKPIGLHPLPAFGMSCKGYGPSVTLRRPAVLVEIWTGDRETERRPVFCSCGRGPEPCRRSLPAMPVVAVPGVRRSRYREGPSSSCRCPRPVLQRTSDRHRHSARSSRGGAVRLSVLRPGPVACWS
jgi:hypothetical protein